MDSLTEGEERAEEKTATEGKERVCAARGFISHLVQKNYIPQSKIYLFLVWS
jgi:hypothetical protein